MGKLKIRGVHYLEHWKSSYVASPALEYLRLDV